MLAPPIESLTVGRGVLVYSRLTFERGDTLNIQTFHWVVQVEPPMKSLVSSHP